MLKGLRRAVTALLIAIGLYSLIGFLVLPGIALRIANQQLEQYATQPARLDRLRQHLTEAARALQVPGLEVTASIGLAQWRPGEDDLAALLRRADHAMYVAKRAGRNRVFDGEELDPPAPA